MLGTLFMSEYQLTGKEFTANDLYLTACSNGSVTITLDRNEKEIAL